MSEVALNIEAGELTVETRGRWTVEWLVFVTGFTTACMSVAAAIYKAPAGVFEDHKCAYYVSVVFAGVVGLAEVLAAITWNARSCAHDAHASLVARRGVLCASFVPLVFMAGVGGVGILVR
ncbi:hypothetical protein BRADI_1g21681v3 [Brachypodium distachyon]|uniref:Uncharacterized protein n=1 Tax=Brachypodium distachyon TaxID=15368 RepID=A0A0Q3KVQ7_BRADI|nr:hypothetical protein BRADI_1g21681v3 [Brachypodium distachyon]